MLRNVRCKSVWVGLSTICLVGAVGCFSSSGVPNTVELVLPDGTTITVNQGAGAVSLANSAWEFSDEHGVAFVTLRFGPNGDLTRFEDNTIAEEMLGSTVIFDGQTHDTGVPPVQYTAATYGAQTSDASGFTFEGQMTATVPILGAIAWGEATATGELDPDDPDVMTGEFTYSFEVSSSLPIEIPIATDDLQGDISFIARRVE